MKAEPGGSEVADVGDSEPADSGDRGPAGTGAREPAGFVFPHDPRDGWEPGAPSLRAIWPSAVFGALVPLGVYYLARSHVGGDAPALAIAGIPAALWVAVEWVRRRSIDPIGAIVIFGFVAGLLASYALGGSAFVLKIRDSAFTSLFGLACLLSLYGGHRPLTFYIGRAMSAGDDPGRRAAFDGLWEMPPARVLLIIINTAWGVGLICDAAARVLLALVLPTGPFLAVSPVVSGIFLGGLGAFTFWVTKWGRGQAESAMDIEIPEGAGTLWRMVRHRRSAVTARRGESGTGGESGASPPPPAGRFRPAPAPPPGVTADGILE
ncbi:MAG TPA: VC0807 family protein [Acidimicrobiales bacterium]|nr:VC0807 family protein [Acidimicrobiales bacterium]